MHRAVRLLAAKPRSVNELKNRLLEKLWTDAEIVDEVIRKLEEYNFLDDEKFAADSAISKLRQKPQGRRSLKQKLSQKQLDKETVNKALDVAFEKMPEEELIRTAVEKRLRIKGRPKTREELKRFYDHLLRRGFSYELIKQNLSDTALDEVLRGD